MTCPRCNQPIADHEAGEEMVKCIIEIVMGKEWDYGYLSKDIRMLDREAQTFYPFRPDTDHNHVYQMEERIAELELKEGYGYWINILTGGMTFRVAHASPEDRCKAALMAVGADD